MNPKMKTALIGSAALLLGLGIGGAGQPDPVAVPAPAPATVTAEPKLVRSPECVKALDAADAIISTGSDALGVSAGVIAMMPEALDAAMRWDADALDRITTDLGDQNEEMEKLNARVARERVTYDTAASKCRSAG